MAKKLSIRNISESRFAASGGRGSKGGWRRIGITARTEMRSGMREFRRRYIASEEGFIELAASVYKAALTPLKLTVSANARGLLNEKFLMQRTKHTVLNQQMLQPDNRERRKTCHIDCKNLIILTEILGLQKIFCPALSMKATEENHIFAVEIILIHLVYWLHG